MTRDQERWAEALMIERQQGPVALRGVAERIGYLLLSDDEAGVERFRDIAIKLERLQRGAAA